MTPTQLKKARQKLGYSQAKLAERLGWSSYRPVSRMENGKASIQKTTELAVKYLLLESKD